MEFRLPDKTRVDCLTKTHAIEVDFAAKKYEAIGQSLYYAYMTKRTPGILLIIETQKDKKHLKLLMKIAPILNITVWTVDAELNFLKQF